MFKKYQRTNLAEMRELEENETKTILKQKGVSISEPDMELSEYDFSLGKIARNPENKADQWYVAKDYFDKNFVPAETLVIPKIAGIVWEQRYSKTLDNDKFGRWMRIGRINGMTVAIITKAEVENKPPRYVVRLPNNTGDESLQNDIITLSENDAMLEAEKYIVAYISNFTA